MLLLPACQALGTGAANAGNAVDLRSASSGLCLTVATLPDTTAAERTFVNLAHAALHQLAAAPGLSRDHAAGVLESMQRVEADFRSDAPVEILTLDLQDLSAQANGALRAIGQTPSPCD